MKDLQRFVTAQEPVYEQVTRQLRDGRKTSHWMWFIFPQIHGLGSSEMAQRYAIASLEEARAYLQHPLLGSRLRECTTLMNAIRGSSARQILGSPDDLKFRSSMTLFAQADQDPEIFTSALARYFNGNGDPATLQRLHEPADF